MMGGGMMGGMAGFGPMMMDGVDKKVENTKDGVVVTLSSKDPETVKMIQEHLVPNVGTGKDDEQAPGQDEGSSSPGRGEEKIVFEVL